MEALVSKAFMIYLAWKAVTLVPLLLAVLVIKPRLRARRLPVPTMRVVVWVMVCIALLAALMAYIALRVAQKVVRLSDCPDWMCAGRMQLTITPLPGEEAVEKRGECDRCGCVDVRRYEMGGSAVWVRMNQIPY